MGDRLQVQVGDEVALVAGSGDYWPRRIRQVFSSGKAAFELEDRTKYTAEGFEVGKRGASGRVLAMKDAVRAHIQRRENLGIVRHTDWRQLSDDQLARIVAILQESQTEGEE